jgi:hypothetical protein
LYDVVSKQDRSLETRKITLRHPTPTTLAPETLPKRSQSLSRNGPGNCTLLCFCLEPRLVFYLCFCCCSSSRYLVGSNGAPGALLGLEIIFLTSFPPCFLLLSSLLFLSFCLDLNALKISQAMQRLSPLLTKRLGWSSSDYRLLLRHNKDSWACLSPVVQKLQ